ncbi:5'-nucleotidase/2',3'-cyclic phosphodiesterase [Candidatus Terasakiella magnetica]|nr:5'-nucleotidase/2',3'-cyclic phosphodiesterase [Candidatus Terasakiella magnetica]
MIRHVVALLVLLWTSSAMAEQVRITFLHVNDIYEYNPVNGKGGLAELATRLDEAKSRLPNAVFTFGGDLLSPSLASNVTKGAHLIEMFNALAPVAAVPGNHEFDFGSAVFAQRITESTFPWIGSNILGSDGKPFGGMSGSLITEIAGVKVGFLGVLTTSSASLSSAGGVTFTDEIATARTNAAQLRAAGAEMVVALTHLDLEMDRKLAAAVPDIDLILGGHDHDPVSIRESGSLILKAGHDAHWLGVVEMAVNRPEPGETGITKITPMGWSFVKVAGAAPSSRLTPLIAKAEGLLDDALREKLATLETAMDSRAPIVRGGEAAIGNLMADALKAHFKADAALLNGGALRGGRQYPPGTVLTRRDVLSELPFGNAVVALDITGRQLLTALEYGVSAVEIKAGRFPQVSGIAMTFDPAQPPGSRVKSVKIGGKPLDLKHVYRLATIDYLLAGGDGYDALKSATVVVDASGGPLLATVVMDLLMTQKTVAPKIEGRVTVAR